MRKTVNWFGVKFKELWQVDVFKGTILSLGLMIVFGSLHSSALYLQTNLIYQNAERIVFDGTSMPILETVNWQKLPEQYWHANYSEVPDTYKEKLTNYDASELAVSVTDLEFSDPRRNAKITYSVPYLGNYQLDGKENVGSHAAVDIKALIGTPLSSIANGIVTRVVQSNAGFGNYVVVLHPGVPDLEDPNKLVNYFSSYSHMDRIDVREGDKISKGQVIGTIGRTGFATTAHVHFQLDREEAPWHPYWPFTSKESSDLGLDLVGAVNAGLGIENGRKFTVHPMLWTQTWLNGAESYSANSLPKEVVEETESKAVIRPVATLRPTSSNLIRTEREAVTVNESEPEVTNVNDLELIVQVQEPLVVGQEANLDFKLIKPNGAPYLFNYKFLSDPFKISVSEDVEFVDSKLDASTFNKGRSRVKFIPLEAGKLRFKVKNDSFSIRTDLIPVSPFKDVTDADQIKVLSHLQDAGVIDGYDDLTFKPAKSVSRVEALKLVLESLDVPQTSGQMVAFADVDVNGWYLDYVAIGLGKGVIEGDPSGQLRPGDQVTLPELLKMLFKAMEVDIDPAVTLVYDGATFTNSDWYVPYLQEALRIGLIDQIDQSQIGEGLSRIDVAELLYRLDKEITL